MIDVILGLVLVGTVLAGYLRGLAREFIEFVVLLIGIPLAFRIGPPVVRQVSDLPDINAAFVGGVLGLIVFVGTAAIFGRHAQRRGWFAPPDRAERIAGALVAAARGIVVAWVASTLLAALPASPVAQAVRPSVFVGAVTTSDGALIRSFATLTGQDDIEAIVEFNSRFPDGPLRTDSYIEIPHFAIDRLTAEPSDAVEILGMVNEARLIAGLSTLNWSTSLSEVAEAYAFEMYTDGFFSHDSARTGNVATRLATAGISYRTAGENLALAPHAQSAHDNLMDSPGHHANIVGPYTSIGIGVVQGPLGIIVVQVFHTS